LCNVAQECVLEIGQHLNDLKEVTYLHYFFSSFFIFKMQISDTFGVYLREKFALIILFQKHSRECMITTDTGQYWQQILTG